MPTNPKWQHLGICHVDAGMLHIGDPCYAAHDNHPEHPIHHWKELCEMLDKPENRPGLQLTHNAGHAGLGVVISTGGDGQFLVKGRFTKHGDLIEIRIMRDMGED